MHGIQAKQKICTSIDRYCNSLMYLPPTDVCHSMIEHIYMPAIEKEFPKALEEMRGIAAGAEVPLSDIILLNASYDLTRFGEQKVGECTSTAYLEDRDFKAVRVYIAQNWDMPSWLHNLDTIIVLEIRNSAADNVSAPRTIITLTEAGQLARSGMNSCGVGMCTNSLWSNEDTSPKTLDVHKPALPLALAQRMFLECGRLNVGFKALCSAPRHVSGNVLVASSSVFAVDLELTPSSCFKIYPEAIYWSWNAKTMILTHSNHFIIPDMRGRSGILDTYGVSSLFRHTQLRKLISGAITTKSSSPPYCPSKDTEVIQSIKTALSDHTEFPKSLCEHADQSKDEFFSLTGGRMTVASVIYDLRKLEMHVCKGTPCVGQWVTYKLEF
jgi:isopenicillin-N N-acyltransferase-like protein